GGTTDPPETNTPPCTEPIIPTNPESGFTDENGCLIGIPTLPNLPPRNNPCEKTKALLETQQVKDAITYLKNHINSGVGGEKGWKFNKDGTTAPTIQNSAHSVYVGDPSTLNGLYHNHTGTTLDMFSATDIDTLLEIVRYQSIGNTSNGFSGMVAPDGIHYVISFNGSHSDLPPIGTFSEIDIEVLKIRQYRNQQRLLADTSGVYCNTQTGKLNYVGLEKVFMDTIKAMGLDNKIVLLRIDSEGIKTIQQNTDGTITAIPCV
ncbi:hypothetical protein, partial [uncultured Chryseobacterium sp.]|uniref:hypothetical protein n=1 Tax=uncultured Chryseobacterium sp. TaxID=259322 RepID=UPI00262A794A